MSTAKCELCHILFIVKPSTRGRFCSMKCAGRASSAVSAVKRKGKNRLGEVYVPKQCINCNVDIAYEKRANKFCSSSCGASYTNRHRIRKDSNPKPLPKRKNKKRIKLPPKEIKFKQSRVSFSFCTICNKLNAYRYGRERKTCSDACAKAHKINIARLHAPTVKLNRGRHKQSYLEKSFEAWINQNNFIGYETEKYFKNNESGKWYYVDFVFENLKLIIELDGSHHDTKDAKTYDTIRDDFLKSLGYNVIRISHKEYREKTKLDDIYRCLNGAG